MVGAEGSSLYWRIHRKLAVDVGWLDLGLAATRSTVQIRHVKRVNSCNGCWLSHHNDSTINIIVTLLLWSPYVIGQNIIFLPCGFYLSFFLLSSFFPRLIPAVGDWMSTILPHMVWP